MPEDGRPRTYHPRAWRLGVGAVLVVLGILFVVFARGDVVFEAASPFGDVRVVERLDGTRELYLGGSSNRQTAMNPDAPLQLELPYTSVMLVAAGTVPDTAHVLMVGLGGGAMPTWLRIARPNLQIDIVEISPAVVQAAKDWFGFKTDSTLTLHVEDAADFVARAPAGAFDLVVLDAFDATGVPETLQSGAFFSDVHRILAPDGVVASNLFLGSSAHAALIERHRGIFRHLTAVKVPRRRQEILFATNRAGGLGVGELEKARTRLGASPAGAPITEGEIIRGFRTVP